MAYVASQIASVVHAAVASLERLHGSTARVEWDRSPEWQRASTEHVVSGILADPGQNLAGQHNAWVEYRLEEGWKPGPLKREEEKEHPDLVPFEKLPELSKLRRALERAVTVALAGMWPDYQGHADEETKPSLENQENSAPAGEAEERERQLQSQQEMQTDGDLTATNKDARPADEQNNAKQQDLTATEKALLFARKMDADRRAQQGNSEDVGKNTMPLGTEGEDPAEKEPVL